MLLFDDKFTLSFCGHYKMSHDSLSDDVHPSTDHIVKSIFLPVIQFIFLCIIFRLLYF